MINTDIGLKKEIFDAEKIEFAAIRDGFGKGLLLAGEKNENVVALSADLVDSTRNKDFAEKFPKRFIEIGVAEQNMAGIAAGLAATEKIPFISSYAVFSPGRNWEQIRTTIAYNNANVKIAGHHTGLSTGPDGATHQALEDIALMRVLPNMKVLVPCDAYEAERAVILAMETDGPVYIRLTREKTPIITTREISLEFGKSQIFWKSENPQLAIFACGPILYQAMMAAQELEKLGVSSLVINLASIKPLDEELIIELAKKCGAVLSCEEHQVAGGLGSAIAEVLVKNFPLPMDFIGINDSFGESGKSEELFQKYELSTMAIVKKAQEVVKRKS